MFREANVPIPDGFEGLKSLEDVVSSLYELQRKNPQIRRAVLKLDESFSGEGNATFTYPDEPGRAAIEDALRDIECSVPAESSERYLEKFQTMGGIVEELLEGETRSPSCQIRIDPSGKVILISTHDQLLGGRTGQLYLGCRFPADDEYRNQIQDLGCRVGETLAAHGVVSRLAIDFLVRRESAGSDWKAYALEINLRIGGTTHPFLALEFLTGGHLDPATGLFHSPSGLAKYYRSTDNLKSEAYRGLSPEDLLDITTVNHLHYSQATETGVLFHMIGAVSQYGKLGLSVIGNSHEQVDAVYDRAIAVLDRETRYGRPAPPGEVVAEPLALPPPSREFRDTIAVPRVWPADD